MARYFLRFRHSDTGLTPTFTFFKKASDLTAQTAPPVGEVGGGTYYFDSSPAFDIVFEVDGGASIPTEEVRYISDTISPKDTYVDVPTSQVKDDVWNDMTDRASGTKGDFIEKIGSPADNSAQATVFGKTLLYKESVRGDTAGTSDGNDAEEIYDRLGAPAGASVSADIAAVKTVVDDITTETDPANIANAVWDESLATHVTVGSAGVAMKNSFKILKNRTKINTTLDTLTVYDDDGTTVLYVFNLKDAAGSPSGETPFERVP
jgi:hypothetical protein